jgi:hypothetical protein
MERVLIEFIAILILLIPTGWQIANDWKGDYNKSMDVLIWSLFAIAGGVVNFLWITGKAVFDSVVLSWGMHFMIFDYLIAYVHLSNGTVEQPRGNPYHWFSYLGSGPVDSIKFWRNMSPKLRLVIRIIVFAGCVAIYAIKR